MGYEESNYGSCDDIIEELLCKPYNCGIAQLNSVLSGCNY